MEPNIKEKAARALTQADAVLIGASNGLSIAEGYHLFADNEMFRRQFGDFRRKYGFRNVLEGCFYPYPDFSERQEYLRRLVQYWVKEYRPSPVMKDLLALVEGKDYFVLTSNGDTHLEKAGFHPDRVYEVEGTFEDLLENRPMENKNPQVRDFLQRCQGKHLVILELGIGMSNRLIKAPLMQLAAREPLATYIVLNLPGQLYIPDAIASKSIALPGDIAVTLSELKQLIPCSV